MVFKPLFSLSVESEICECYADGEPLEGVAQIFGCHRETVRGILERHNVARRPRRQPALTDLQVREACTRYCAGESAQVLASELGVSPSGLRKILRRNGVQVRTRSEARTRYHHNPAAFEDIDTESSAYWLGFLAADGNWQRRGDGQAQLFVSLHTKDREHVLKLRAFLQSNHPIHEIHFHNPPRSQARLVIRSDKLCADLERYGVTQRKSATLRFPELRDGLVRHYIRGYVDGDGGVYVRIDKTGPRYSFSVTSNRQFLDQIQGFLMQACELRRTKIDGSSMSNPLYGKLVYGGRQQVTRIACYLYRDATVYLDRKFAAVRSLLA